MRTVNLSADDIEGAIKFGLVKKGDSTGLMLRDSMRGFMNAMSKPGDQSGSGFSLRVYTPVAWIQQQASDAAKEYRPFRPKDLDETARDAVLRVVVYPDTPSVVSAKGMRLTSSVQHVVLRDASKKVVVQPIGKEPFEEEASNAMGGKAMFRGVRATFALDEIASVRGPNGSDEFFITVIGEKRAEKDFKVKAKHFDDLPGLVAALKK